MAPRKTGIGHRLQIALRSYRRLTARFVPAIRNGSTALSVIAFIASIICITGILIHFGYDLPAKEARQVDRIIRGCQIAFIVNILYNYLLRTRETIRDTRIIKWIVDLAVLLTLLPLVYPRPEAPWFPWLDAILYSRRFLFPVLAAYSIVDISYASIKLLGKRTNPSLILSASFLLFILIGSLTLMMPRCTVHGISFIDSLFVSTSAVCITGLTSVDLSATFTPTGLLVLAVMIQVGGLGIMTFTSFFALFFSGNTSIYSQLMVRDMVYSKSLSSLIPTILYILVFTQIIELIGAVGIYFSLPDELAMSQSDKLIFAGFHSLSAFCNAGFSNVEGGLSNPALLHGNQWLYAIITLLVAMGGIGFPILMNFKQAVTLRVRNLWQALRNRRITHRTVHIYDLNTKIVLITSAWLTVGATALFLILEYNNTLAGFSFTDKLVQSFFNSLVPRSSGFSSVSPAEFINPTIIMFMLLMWIGGASQSTAGGIKVNTFATMLLTLRTVVSGRMRISAFGRTIAIPSIRRAYCVVALSILALFIYSMILAGLEPTMPLKALVYEATSALFTVGSSLGITPMLTPASKLLLCSAMFIGRVGIISLLMGFFGNHTDPPYHLPEDNIIIN